MRKSKLLKKRYRWTAAFCIVTFLNQIAFPTVSFALSGGPSAPEFGSFQQASTTDMVDLFTGDFSYNIPLVDVDGYPLNLSYSGNVGMEQEASWVGLGWNLNPGMVNRNIRGVPDDFNGDEILETNSRKKEVRVSMGAALMLEAMGFNTSNATTTLEKLGIKLTPSLDMNYSTKRGFSLGGGIQASYRQFSLGLSGGAENGFSINPGISFSTQIGSDINANLKATVGFNNRSGYQNVSLSADLNSKKEKTKDGVKEMKERATGSLNQSIPLVSSNSYFPGGKANSKSSSFAFNVKIGGNLTFFDGDIAIKGSYWQDVIDDETKTLHSYGYNYLQNAEDDPEAVLDFNVDGDPSGFSPGMSMLPPAMLTYDVYSVVGQGFSGVIRPKRMETGAFSEPEENHFPDLSLDVGGEVATGNTLKLGVDRTVGTDKIRVQPWDVIDDKYGNFDANPLFSLEQNSLFIKGVQQGQMNDQYYADIDKEIPIAFTLTGKNDVDANSAGLPTKNQFSVNDKFQRIAQDEIVQVFTHQEASIISLNKSIITYTTNSALSPIAEKMRLTDYKPHHVGDIIATKNDGSRYVYGIPVLNKTKKDLNFNASKRLINDDKSLVTYALDLNEEDNSVNNNLGVNKVYSCKTTPEYAYAHLITGYLSPDYIDTKGDGITSDDIGTAVKFNWRRTHDNYKWRIPMTSDLNNARFSEGSMLSEQDQMANYSYGEKEIYYAHSIETKNHILFFEISERRDGAQAIGENGGVDTSSLNLFKLDNIKLFSKKDYSANSIPIKTIHFEYSYELCPKTVNNNEFELYLNLPPDPVPELNSEKAGKLTLKSVEIYYGNDKTGALSPYKFDYSDSNPEYSYFKSDKWGNYKSENPSPYNTDALGYQDFPYSNETPSDAEINADASSWQLNKITLPSGGIIEVEYESDEYAYVQDRLAKKMFTVKGIGSSDDFVANETLHDGKKADSSLEYMYLYVEKPSDISNDEECKQLYSENFNGTGEVEPLYFKVKVEIPPKLALNNDSERNYEYIRGYFIPEQIGICDNDGTKLFIKMKSTPYNEKGDNVNPILKAALDYTYSNHQTMLFGGLSPEDGQIEKFIKNLFSIKDDIVALFSGPYGLMIKKNMCDKVKLDDSGLLRLNHPKKRKKGGGIRVKSIIMSDEWSQMTSGTAGGDAYNSSYGQTYSYDYPNGETSGVATYEPMQGNDENPFKMPHFYYADNSNSKKPQPLLYQEEPIGELFYPSASVGYGYVKVESIHQGKKSERTYTENEFYTARNFPLKVERTDLQYEKGRVLIPAVLVNFDQKDGATSQGYSLIFNDMHGKPKAEKTWLTLGSENKLLSSTEYLYHTDGSCFSPREKFNSTCNLKNEVQCLTREGLIEDKTIGVTVDVDVYSKFVKHTNTSTGVEANLSSFLTPVPVAVPPVWGNQNTNITNYRSVVVTKMIQKSGLLKEIRYKDEDVETTVKNEIFDEHTGQVLLTSSTTQYDVDGNEDASEKKFNTTIPSYFAKEYARMGHAYRNIGYQCIPDPLMEFLTTANLNGANPQEQDAIRALIYKGYLDGLLATPVLYNGSLKGNQVQAGVFVEGDEVYVTDVDGVSNPSIAYVSEVVTEEDLNNVFLGLFPSGQAPTNTLGSPTPGSTSGSGGSTAGNTNTVPSLICNGQVIEDIDLMAMYTQLVNASQYVPLPTPGIMQSMSSVPVNPSAQTISASSLTWDYLYSLSNPGSGTNPTNTLSKFYSIWNQSWGPDLYDVIQFALTNSQVRTLLGELDSQDSQSDLLTLLRCEKYRNCLNQEANNSGLLPVLDFLTADVTISGSFSPMLNFSSYLSSYYNDHFISTELLNNPATCKLNQGLYELNGLYYSVVDYEGFFNTSSGLSQFNINGGLTLFANPSNEGIAEEPCNVVNYTSPFNWDLLIDCGAELIEGDNSGSNAVSSTNKLGNNVVTDNQDYTYNEPAKSELVMFVDRDGVQKDLNGRLVKIIRSGRRNQHTSAIAQETSINTNQFLGNQGKTYFGYLQSSATGFSDEWTTDFMPKIDMAENDVLFLLDQEFNPFITGHRGVFRPNQTFAFKGWRENPTSSDSRHDGLLRDYQPYWNLDGPIKNQVSSSPSTFWVDNERMISYSMTGAPIESENALGIPSAEIVGENNQILASATNARVSDILFESFEPYEYGSGLFQLNNLISTSAAQSGSNHVPDNRIGSISESDEAAHSGKYSLKRTSSDGSISWSVNLAQSTKVYDNAEYRSLGFRPQNGNYVVSLWVKAIDTSDPTYDPLATIGSVIVSTSSPNTSVPLYPSGNMIDGWMRIEGVVSIPSSYTSLTLTFSPGASGTYFDDLRIFPEKASFKSFVYDGSTQRLMCILDENNYGTFYRYASDGTLKKLERETINGRLTVKESYKGNKKTP
jgi:hypothetical protein